MDTRTVPMKSYQIIDEPKPMAYKQFITDPLAIFMVSILIPVLWTPPLLGKYWVPLVWLITNGYLLGSPTLRKEVLTALVGGTLFFLMFFYQLQIDSAAAPYLKILAHGIFFFTLYTIVFAQSGPYDIYAYIKSLGEQ